MEGLDVLNLVIFFVVYSIAGLVFHIESESKKFLRKSEESNASEQPVKNMLAIGLLIIMIMIGSIVAYILKSSVFLEMINLNRLFFLIISAIVVFFCFLEIKTKEIDF